MMLKHSLIALVLFGVVQPLQSAEIAKRPNILFIFSDDQSYKTVGCYPESFPWVKTPNIDYLASQGVRFHSAYFGSWCMPSRASFLTGRLPHGIESMRMEGKYPASAYDPAKAPFWPAVFRKHGYHTAQIGKWHTGIDSGWNRDWDHQIVWNRPLHPENAGAYYDKQILAINGREQLVEGYPADNYNKWAREFIEGKSRDKDKPWFLWLCHGSIHGPSKPAPRHKGMYAQAEVPLPKDIFGPRPGKPEYLNLTQAWLRNEKGVAVAGKSGEAFGDESRKKEQTHADFVRQMNECVPAVDEGVGMLLKSLKDSGQLENTLVVFGADQGFGMGEHGFRTKLGPYDATYRSPLIVSMPGVTAKGKVCTQPVNAPDLVATFLALANIKVPWEIHGKDLVQLLKNPEVKTLQPCLYQHTGTSFGSDVEKVLRESPSKAEHTNVPWYDAVVYDGWKYIHYLKPGVGDELYELKADPEELENRIKDPKAASRLIQLREKMDGELKRINAPEIMRFRER